VVGGAAYLPDPRVIGIDVDAAPERVADDGRRLSRQVATRMDLETNDLDSRVEVVGAYAGPSYGTVPPEAMEAISLFGKLEGLMLDPVYTGKAAVGPGRITPLPGWIASGPPFSSSRFSSG